MIKHEFISNPTVKVLRWDEKLLIFPSLLMFRIHDNIEVVNYESTSISRHKPWVGNSAPIPFECCCSDPDYFTMVVRDALRSLNLFLPHNNQILSELIPEYFHSCYNCNYTADPTSDPKIVVMVEVFRKTVYIDKPTTTEEEEEEIEGCGKLAATVKLQAEEELGDQYLQDEEDYSKLALEGILGNLIDHLMIKGGYQLSTLATIDELVQVKAAIRLLIFNGRRCSEDECAVCYEGFCQGQHIARMPCPHIFHKDCAFKWLLRCGSCPLCRSGCKTSVL